jgi:hypothetical protein
LCQGDTIVYQDLNSVVSVTIDGNPIADGGRVSNLVFSGDSVTFDLLLPTDIGFATVDGYTQLLAANGSVSDVLLYEVVNGQPSYQVTFGSVPDLPVIPPPRLT